MKKRHLSIFILLIFSLLCVLGFRYTKQRNSFDISETIDNIEYLSSEKLGGRLAGTLGNTEASVFVRDWFKKNGIEPLTKDYMESFEVLAPKKLNGSAYLKIVNSSGAAVHQFKYGTDFKEDMLNFQSNSINFNKKDQIHQDKGFITVAQNNKIYLFYCPEDNNLSFRSSFFSDSNISLCVLLNKNAFDSMKNYIAKGYNVQCFLPYETEKVKINNVLGIVKGKRSNLPPIVISAHFDHLGNDLSGNTYFGALDNASGTAFMMELAKLVKSIGQPERDIIFAAFNAEEFGCLGSKYFVQDYKGRLSGSQVFNFDMIGSDQNVPISIIGGSKDNANSPLVKDTAKICSDKNISFKYSFEDCSDHEFFRKNNIDAVTLCDNDISKIHTPSDKSEYISESSIHRSYILSSKLIIKYAYSDYVYYIYNNTIFFIFIVLVITIFTIVMVHNKIKEARKSNSTKIR
ncbi:Zn-dependent exopeptidase M28 [Clostridium sp. 19966]|uniref:M28 family metallopeptidase n=1 Tax=Clostridium sp. 19966 TaxID=2768166 RepID=UPI0028DD9BE5|nr:M28 family metallopeptidase [Clostridium sp. 19966]MDT8715567.1 Zn-dependent exopeptidase M28 [Clostridium sp. 19966]